MSFFQKSIRSDEDLLTSLRQGSEDAFTVIYERYHKLLYVLAYKYLKSTYSSEDAVQQVFLKLWEARSLLMVNVNLRNYLYTMLKNHVLNEIRNNNSAVEKNYEIVQSAPEYEDELLIKIEEQDMMSHFYQAIDHLPEQKRQVCLYKLKGNLSNQEIADKYLGPHGKNTLCASDKNTAGTFRETIFISFIFVELILLMALRVN